MQSANKAAVQQLTDAWNARDREAFLSVHAPAVTFLSAEPTTLAHDALWEAQQVMFRAFPDVTVAAESMLEEDGRVLVCWRVSGTNEGALPGGIEEPTGRSATWREWALYRLEDGRVTEAQFLADYLGMFEQLEVVSLPV